MGIGNSEKNKQLYLIIKIYILINLKIEKINTEINTKQYKILHYYLIKETLFLNKCLKKYLEIYLEIILRNKNRKFLTLKKISPMN